MKKKNYIKNILLVTALGISILFFINISLAANTAKVNVETANLRETADSNSTILEQLNLNEEVEILEESGDWYKVEARNITGFLRKDLLTVNEEVEQTNNTESNTEEVNNQEETNAESNQETTNQTQEETTTDTNEETKKVAETTKLKIVPAINATDIIEVKQDETVTVIETMNDWVCIQTGTTKGWIRSDKLKSAEEETTEPVAENEENTPVEETVLKTLYVAETTVNVRKEPNTTSEVVTKLNLNTKVDVYSEENEWSKVKVNNQEGYILTSLLSDKKKEETTSRSATTPRKETTESKEETKTPTAPSTGKGSTVVETAKKYIGYPYVYGASGPSSFDCSGFTSYVFKLHGVTLNRTAKGQYSNGTAVSRSDLQPGDLIMFGPSASGINHVGIYIGGGQIVHAANKSRGVTTDTINSGYYNKNYVGARRVI